MGNKNKIYRTLGASNATEEERAENDYYATDPLAAELLLQIEDIPKDKAIWECAAGEKHLANVFEAHGYSVFCSDLVKRLPDVEQVDFLNYDFDDWKFDGTIITNPPYSKALDFIKRSLDIVQDGNKIFMFLRLQFLEGKKRKEFFEKNPPKTIWVASSRIMCAKNGDFEKLKSTGGSAVAFAWFVWEKGYTVIKWFN